MSQHAKLSPSSAERWFNCPGSLNLIATLPATAFRTSKYAAEGTVAHQVAEDFVRGKVDLLTLTTRVGETVMQDGQEIEITDAMVEGVIEYVDHIAAMRRRMTKPNAVVSKAEVRAFVGDFAELVYGTTDYLLYQKGHELHVFDFKYGKRVVEADENKQGLTYIVGVQDRWESEGEEGAAGKAFDKVFFHIVQPRARHGDGTARVWELPPGRVEAFRKELIAAVKRTQDPHAPRKAGPWCGKTFCPAIAYCPEASSGVQHAVDTVFTKMPAPPSKEVGRMSLPEVTTLTPEQVGKVLDWEDTIDSYIEAVRERAQVELAKDPNAVPGYKLVEGRSNRVWTAESEVETAFAMLGEELYQPREIKTPAQLEKIAGKEEVAKYVFKPAGKLTVAKADDKRQAVTHVSSADAGAVFGAVAGFAAKQMAATIKEEDNIFGDLAGPPAKKETIWP